MHAEQHARTFRKLTSLLLLSWTCIETTRKGVLAGHSAAVEGRLGYRILFKPRRLAGDADMDASFLDGLPKQHDGLRRRLLDGSGGQQMQIQSLGQQTGMNMVQVPQGVNASDVLRALQDHPGVEFAEVDKVLSAYGQPNDPDLPQQWAMYQLGLFSSSSMPVNGLQAQGAWNRSTGSDEVVVCVIDSGIDYTHPDLQGNVWVNHHEIPNNGIDDDANGFIDDYYGWNFLSNSGNNMDNNYHGTHLSGMVGALCNNGIGVCGVNQVVKVMGCKFLDGSGNGYTSDAVRCLDYAQRMGADITLNSYGGLYADSYALQAAIQAAEDKGQLFVTAAGNDYGTDIDATPTYPAAYTNTNIVSVIATDESDQLANYSNYGLHNSDIAAPGSKILSTVLNGQYGMHEGTSQSAGFVAGAAALLLAAYRAAGINATGAMMKSPIMSGAESLAQLKNRCKSGGKLDIGRAMSFVPQRPQAATTASPIEAPAAAPGAAPMPSSVEPPMLSGQPIKVSKPKLVLGDYPPSPDTVASKSVPGPDTAQEPVSGSWSLVDSFSGAFPLQQSSVTFAPQYNGIYAACLRQGVQQFVNPPEYGQDITSMVLQSSGAVMSYEVAGALVGDQVQRESALIKADGTVQLPAASVIFGTGSASALSVWSLANSSADIRQGGQVTWYQTPDRAVLSYVNISTGGIGQSSWQVELFTAFGHYQPAGAVRVTWLHVAAQHGRVGLDVGSNNEGSTDFLQQACCQAPAKLALQVLSVQPVQLEAARAGRAAGTASITVPVANQGNTSLAAAFSLERRNASVLVPDQWLDPSSGYQQLFSGLQGSCGSGQGQQQQCYAFSHGAEGGLVARGGAQKTIRYATTVEGPLRVSGQISRTRECADHHIILSTSPTPPTQAGDESSLYVYTSCGQRLLQVGNDAVIGQGATCVSFGSSGLSIELGMGLINVMVDGCSKLAAQQYLGAGPFYLYLGTQCSAGECPGGITWESLELEQGPGTMVGQIENVAQNSQQILVQQAPGGPPSTSLQDMLQLPAYPTDEGASPPQPPPPPSQARGSIVLPTLPQRFGQSPSAAPSSQAGKSPGPPGGVQQGEASGAQVSAASVPEGRRLLGTGSPGGQGRAGPMGSWGIVRRLRRLLLLSDQDGASLASHLQLGSPQAGSSVSQGDEVDVQQDSWALAPAAEERGAKPTRVHGTLQAPLVALQATSFLDMGAPTEAVLPGAAPSQGTSQGLLGQADGSPVGWVATEPPSLTVPPFSSSSLLLQFSSAGLDKGTYQAALIMYSNDPEQPITRLPLQLEIN